MKNLSYYTIQMYQNGTKNWIKVNDLSSGQNSASKNIRFKTSILRSNLCDYSYVYIVVKRTVTAEGNNDAKKRNKNMPFLK